MPEPYRMTFINATASLILLVVIFLYKYFYPKRRINFLLLLILISIIASMSTFRIGAYESGDFNIHLYRTIDFYKSLQAGNFFPSWAADLNATYGYPLFIFNYPLPYYLISFLHFLGFSFITSMKLFLFTNFMLSGVLMYICMKKLFNNTLASFTSAIFYQFAPYHLIDQNFKIVIGEILVFTFLPLTWFSFQKLWEKQNRLWVLLSGIILTFLIMSHVVLGLSYRSGVKETRKSPGIKIARELQELAKKVFVYDPLFRKEEVAVMKLNYKKDFKGIDCIVITTKEDRFKNLDWGNITDSMSTKTLVDTQNIIDFNTLQALGFSIRRIGYAT